MNKYRLVVHTATEDFFGRDKEYFRDVQHVQEKISDEFDRRDAIWLQTAGGYTLIPTRHILSVELQLIT